MDNRQKLIWLTAACKIFDEISPNELRILLWLRLNDLPSHIDKMDVGISEKRLKDLISDMKKKGIVQQRVMMGSISLTPTGNKLLDSLLEKLNK